MGSLERISQKKSNVKKTLLLAVDLIKAVDSIAQDNLVYECPVCGCSDDTSKFVGAIVSGHIVCPACKSSREEKDFSKFSSVEYNITIVSESIYKPILDLTGEHPFFCLKLSNHCEGDRKLLYLYFTAIQDRFNYYLNSLVCVDISSVPISAKLIASTKTFSKESIEDFVDAIRKHFNLK